MCRLYTGPLRTKYNARLRGLGVGSAAAREVARELCADNGYAVRLFQRDAQQHIHMQSALASQRAVCFLRVVGQGERRARRAHPPRARAHAHGAVE